MGDFATKIFFILIGLKCLTNFFVHEKVEMIPTFSSRNISPRFACKIKTNKSAHAQ